MADVTMASGPYRLAVPIKLMGTDSDALVLEYGVATFGDTVDVAELPLSYISEVCWAGFTWKSATGTTVADGQVSTDGVVTSGAITVARTGHIDLAASFYYLILGRQKVA